MPSNINRTYSSRALTHNNELVRELFRIVEEKKSNLCLSVDVTDPEKALQIIETLAPKLCMVKTHIDILSFDPSTPNAIPTWTSRLQHLSRQHSFLIFEDRKFADIGSTVVAQYTAGVYRIADWAHVTNAHSFPGPGIVDGLVKCMRETEGRLVAEGVKGWEGRRGLLLLAEMSSKGNLSTEGAYREKTLGMARGEPRHVMGFIAQSRKLLDEFPAADKEEDFLILTPGVGLDLKGDGLGQQYRTPEEVIGQDGCDIMIVGRGIYGQEDMLAAAERYRSAGWEAYSKRIETA